MTSPKTIRYFILTIMASSFSVSLLAQENRLEFLQNQRKAAIDRIVTPINEKYVVELEKLLKVTISSGDLDQAVKIREEIERFRIGSVIPSVTSNIPVEKFSERWLIDTEWVALNAEKPQKRKFQKGIFKYFSQDGQGNWTEDAGAWKWEVENESERKIKITYYSGEVEIIQFSEDLSKMRPGAVTGYEWDRVKKEKEPR